ncbi:SufD family Fe-S cluster assembly protein [Candidatus Woesearchaeota archaeon]|nr:SufD family Fe-S cluster assembly protein [Candidatus Woesearchaeota archaeon]
MKAGTGVNRAEAVLDELEDSILLRLGTRLREEDWAMKARLESFRSLRKTSFPSFRYASGILVKPNFSLIDFSQLSRFVPETESAKIGFIGPEEISVIKGTRLSQIDEKTISLFRGLSYSEQSCAGQPSWFSLFNDAFANSFLLLRIPAGLKLDRPAVVEIDADHLPQITNIFIITGTGSKAKVFIKKRSRKDAEGGNWYFGLNVRVFAGEESELRIMSTQQLGLGVAFFEDRKAHVSKAADVEWFDLSFGAGYANSAVLSNLAGMNARTGIRCLFAATNNQKIDLFTSAIHAAPRTRSDILTRGVVNEEARALSRGLIVMQEGSGGSEGYEKQDTLLLCDRSEANAIPELEIRNHDVKCSHGSTVGQIESDKLFYLLSRGIMLEDAKKLIIKGYFDFLLSELSADERSQATVVLEEALVEV